MSGVRVFAGACALLVAVWSNDSRAHGSVGGLLTGLGLTLLPATGLELLTQPDRDPDPRLLLSWQFSLPLDWSRRGLGRPIHHRLVIGPELLFSDGQARGRIGYRFVYHPFFAGIAAGFGSELGLTGSVEAGWRFATLAGSAEARNRSPNFYLTVRTDSPLDSNWGNVWASSLCVGFGLY